MSDASVSAPRDPCPRSARLPRTADGPGRPRARGRGDRYGGRPVRAARPGRTRRTSCATAATASAASASAMRSPTSIGEIGESLIGAALPDQRDARPRPDRPRRNAGQVAARRQRDPRRLAGGRARPRRRLGHAAVPGPERERARAPGAAGQPDQRRQARLQRPRLPGVHRDPGRGGLDPRGAADLDRGQPRAGRDPARALRQERPQHRRRGRLRPGDLQPPGGARTAARGGRRRRPRGPLPLRARLRRDPLLRPRRPGTYAGRRRDPRHRRDDRALPGADPRLRRDHDRGPARRGGLRRVRPADRRERDPDRRRRPLRHQPGAPAPRRSPTGPPTRCSGR